jgi:hypothetical protein
MTTPPAPDSTIRYHAVFSLFGETDDGPYEEVIGRLVRVESMGRVDDPSWPTCWYLLYEDTEGLLYYVEGYEEEPPEGWERYRVVGAEFYECGRTRKEIVEKIRRNYDPDFEIPGILEEPPPEIEDMHRETGYDS